jgi:pimeloyl-ACP methyl ester carboxylesterase
MPTIETNGIQTYYEEYGEGAPVVCVHGATSDHQLFAEQFEPLSDDAKIIVYDLRGHGRTEGSNEESYTMSLYAEDLAALIDELGLDKPVICGLSLGGMIGYTFATTRPEQLSGLITLGAMTPQTFSTREWLIRVVLARAMTPILGNDRVMSGVTQLLDKVFSDSSTGEMDDRKRIREAHSCGNTEEYRMQYTRIMAGVQDYIGSSIEWQSADIPILAMYGEDEPFAEHHCKYVSERVNECRTREIPNAPHNSHVDNPEFIMRNIKEFIENMSDKRAAIERE